MDDLRSDPPDDEGKSASPLHSSQADSCSEPGAVSGSQPGAARQGTRITIGVDPSLCSGCGYCVDHCPHHAVTIVDDLAVVGDRCGLCMACLHLCLEDAMEVVRAPRPSSPEARASCLPQATSGEEHLDDGGGC